MKNQSRVYDDPLHVPSEQLVVYFNEQPIYMMNKRLLDQQNCWSNLEAIKETHWLKLLFYEMIRETNDPVELKELAKDITECEFELQSLWGFTKDAKFHRFWETPKCICAKMDNEDAYPTGYYSITLSCPLHGDGR
jgi:hypothetical protein